MKSILLNHSKPSGKRVNILFPQLNILILVVYIIVLPRCSNDPEIAPRDYPYIITLDVIDISKKGATFNAKILNEVNDPVEDFGFIWNNGKFNYSKSLVNESDYKNFSLRVSEDLEANSIYYCQAYIIVKGTTFKGNQVSFKSKGSMQPAIEDFTPKEGFDGTQITITGNHFSSNPLRNKVLIEEYEAEVLYSNADSVICKIPQMPYFGEAKVTVEVGNQEDVADLLFKLHGPKIDNVFPLSGAPGEKVTITGEYFTNNGNTSVLFGNVEASIESLGEKSIAVWAPPMSNPFANNNILLKIKNGLKVNNENINFTVKKSWEHKTSFFDMPGNYYTPYTAFTYKGNAYVLTYKDDQYLYKYEPDADKWTKVPSSRFPEITTYNSSIYIISDDILYKIGGNKFNDTPIDKVWKFDFKANHWSETDKIPFSFIHAIHFEHEGYTYIITENREIWKCNLTDWTFKRKHNFPIKFEDKFAFTFRENEEQYVIAKDKTWKYDFTDDSWSEIANNQFAADIDYQNGTGFNLNNKGYILEWNRLYRFENKNQTWVEIDRYPGKTEEYRTCFVLDNEAYVVGFGYDGLRSLLKYINN